MIRLYKGDCLTENKHIEDGSVDLILCDPPYGTIKNCTFGNSYSKDEIYWDDAIDPVEIMKIANRILRKNGKVILFSQEPYTSRLIQGKYENINFNYRMIWEKDQFANCLLAKVAPVSYFEDILVFSKRHDQEQKHPLREYFSKVLEYIGKTRNQINKELGHRKAEHSFYVQYTVKNIDDDQGHQRANHTFRTGSSQFALCTEDTYKEIISFYKIDQMPDFVEYEELKKIDSKQAGSIFNLWQNKPHKSNILKYSKDYEGHHPTQKPVLLLEDLIKTYSNQGNLVVDLTMGSGSTGIACHNTDRHFIGIERDDGYFEIASKRLQEHQRQLRLF